MTNTILSTYSHGHRQIPSRTAIPGVVFHDAHYSTPEPPGAPSTLTSRTVIRHPQAPHHALASQHTAPHLVNQ